MKSSYLESIKLPNPTLQRRFEIASGKPPIANLSYEEHERIYRLVNQADDWESLPVEIREMVEAAEAN